jgi:hypothetical protein
VNAENYKVSFQNSVIFKKLWQNYFKRIIMRGNFMFTGINWKIKKVETLNPQILSLIFVILLCVILLSGVIVKNIWIEKQEMPLLLNSSSTTAKEAELRIALWFKQKPAQNLMKDLPQDGWVWKESELKAYGGTTAYTLSGYKVIQAEEEKLLFSWFRGLSRKVQDYGGLVYLDERIPEGIDIIKYSVQEGISPVQWALAENTLSVTGLKDKLYPEIRAGDDSVNIQLLSQSNGKSGRTALAIPVLLEEF